MRGNRPLVVLLVLVGLAHLATLFWGVGSFWFADELIQYIEQPYRVLNGLPPSAWEFQAGTRNWTMPGLVLGLLWLADLVGIENPLVILVLLRLVTKVAFLGALARLAASSCTPASRWTELLPAGLVGLCPILLLATNHTLSEVWSLIPLVWGWAEWQVALQGQPRRAAYAGVAVGLAVLVRLQTVVLLPLLILLSWWPQRQSAGPRPLWQGGVALALTLLAGAWLDGVTYGSFGHSLVANLSAHLGDGGRLLAVMGTSPWHFYVTRTLSLAPGATVVLSGLWVVGALRNRRSPLVWSVLLYVVVHSTIPHKELRFLLPALPLALLTAGEGVLWLGGILAQRERRWRPVAAALLVAGTMVPMTVALGTHDQTDAATTRLLVHARRTGGPVVLATVTPGRTMWPAQSRFIVGLETRATQRLTDEQVAGFCVAEVTRGALLLFGPEAEIAGVLETARANGCTPTPLATSPPWQLLRLR